MSYYLTFNNGRDFEAYGNLKLGSKKLKQQDWFKLEPQTLSFDLLYYPLAASVQEEVSNYIIDSIFTTGSSVSGIVRNAIVKLYSDNVLLFTGVVDLSQCQHNKITKDSKIFCYDYLRLLGLLKDDEDATLSDNIYTFNSIVSFLQNELTTLGITDVTLDNQATLPTNGDDVNIQMPIKQELIANINSYTWSGFSSAGFIKNETVGHPYYGCVFFLYNMNKLDSDGEDSYGISHEYIVISFNGLAYSEVYRDYGYKSIWSGSINDAELAVELSIAVIEATLAFRVFSPEYTPFYQQGVTSYTDQGLTYTLDPASGNSGLLDATIIISGNQFRLDHACGNFLKDGYSYIESNINNSKSTNIIDVFKQHLMSGNFICYTSGSYIKIMAYEDYTNSHIISDDDIMFLDRKYVKIKRIDKIDGISANTELWEKALNQYNASYISAYIYPVKIIKSGNENIKAGDRITNTTYGINNLFIIEINSSPENMYIDIVGV